MGRILKGRKLEEMFSLKVHDFNNSKLHSVLLIDQNFLKEFSGGQIDLCTIEKISSHSQLVVKVYEVKSEPFVSYKQRQRLKNSANILCEVFKLSVIIEVLSLDF